MTSELKRAYEYCVNVARLKAGNFYYAFLFLPPPKLRAISALYAFCHSIDKIVDEGKDPVASKDRLEQFHRDFQDCLQGNYRSKLYRALGDSIHRFRLPQKHFFDLIAGMESDLSVHRFQDFSQLREYCYKAASTVGLLCVEIFGYDDIKVKTYAENLGIALQLTNIIRDVGEDFQRGRIYLPLEDFSRFNYSEADLAQKKCDKNFLNLIEFQYSRAVEYYHLAEQALPPKELKIQIASEIMKNIYRELLETIKLRNFPVLEGRVKLSSSKKLSIALRTAWAVRNGRFL